MGFFGRLRDGLARTRQRHITLFDRLATRVDASGRGGDALDGDTADELEELLVSADVGIAATERIMSGVRASGRGSLRACVESEIRAILRDVQPRDLDGARPSVILLVGVNGTGKTTTVGKLARRLKAAGRTPLVCAADTFRAAAVEQLQLWADRAGVDIIRAREGADPAAVVFDAISAAKARGRDVVLIDTAGRLHTRVDLMRELEKITRVAAREVESAPHEVLLVLDATVGQNGLVQARAFTEVAGVTGIVLTKLDGTAKGGVAVAVAQDLRLPIRFVGVGEGIDDLIPFSADEYTEALFERSW